MREPTFYYLLLLLWMLADLLLWRMADRRARAFRRPLLLRLIFAAYFLLMAAYLLVPFSHLWLGHETTLPPTVEATAAVIWHPIVLMLTLLVMCADWGRRLLVRLVRGRRGAGRQSPKTIPESPPPSVVAIEPGMAADVGARFSRRRMLGLVVSAAPPLATAALTAAALGQRGDFRIRQLTLSIPSLPDDLDGMTIAHLSDLHLGNFLSPETAARIADATNALQADLVLFTGDLIDRGLLDRLPLGIDFINRLDRRHGFAIIEGNHDVQEDAGKFEQAMRDLKLPFLLDQELVVQVPSRRVAGRMIPVQLLGIAWGEVDPEEWDDKMHPQRTYNNSATAQSIARVVALRRPEAFPILLAHHPHAFDPAIEHGFPLTLSGHTHGGQIMLTQNIGAGPMRFRYWNGVHEREGCQLVISNGLGSWFPLRVNAPAEILHLTLKKGVVIPVPLA